MLPAIKTGPPTIRAQRPTGDEAAFMTAMVDAGIGLGDDLVVI
jgi:hypothetical protein